MHLGINRTVQPENQPWVLNVNTSHFPHVNIRVNSLTLDTALWHGSVGMVDNATSLFSEMNLLCAMFLASAHLLALLLCICLHCDILIQIPHSVLNLTNKGNSYHTLSGWYEGYLSTPRQCGNIKTSSVSDCTLQTNVFLTSSISNFFISNIHICFCHHAVISHAAQETEWFYCNQSRIDLCASAWHLDI